MLIRFISIYIFFNVCFIMRKWKKQIHTFIRMDNNQKISKFNHQIPQSLVITPESSNVTQRKLILRQDRRDWKQPTFPWRRMSHGLQQAFPLLPRIPCFPIMEWEGLLSRHLTLLPQGYLRGCPSTLDQIWYGPTFFYPNVKSFGKYNKCWRLYGWILQFSK